MSLYTFATANLTTSDDLHRKPAIDTWQIVRTLALVATAFLALVYMARHSHTAEPSETPVRVAAR